MNLNLNRWMCFFLCALMAFTLLPVAAEQAPALSEEQLQQINEALQDETKDLPIQEEYRVKIAEDDLSVTEGLNEDWMNILLLGTDTGSIKLNYGRTDTMIILSVNRKTGKMRLASLVRDMLVNIPYHNRMHRINVANAFGGPLMAVKTVNETFGLNIRSYVSINFSGFKNVIDSLGGVELTLTGPESQLVGVPGSSEPQVLNGEQALAYVRIRALDNNFGRNQRQRNLLSSLFNKMLRESTMEQAMSALAESMRHMATNLSINDLLALVVPVFAGMEEMDTAGFPVAGDFQGETTKEGASVINFDHEATQQKLHAYIYEGVTP